MTRPQRKTTERGYGWQWQKLRLLAFEVYGRDCYLCGAYATTVDHLVPIKYRGPAVPSVEEVRPACKSCNSRKGARLGLGRGLPVLETSRDWFGGKRRGSRDW